MKTISLRKFWRNTYTVGVANLVLMLAIACAPTPRTSPAPAPIPAPSPTAEIPAAIPTPPEPSPSPATTSWIFAYAPQPATYSLTTTGSITPLSDTLPIDSLLTTALPTRTERVVLQLQNDTGFVAIQPYPVTPNSPCSDSASLYSRAPHIIPTLPNRLTIDTTWTEQVTTMGCRGPVLATTQENHTYRVVGDTVFENTPVLLIRRTESIQSQGEGSIGQHRVLLSAQGTGESAFYLNVATGRLFARVRSDSLNIDVQTSGRHSRFLQKTNEVVRLER